MGTHRIIGTTQEAISDAENDLKMTFPLSFRNWLLSNNGSNLQDFTMYPVMDHRDKRKTWDSIVRRYREDWLSWISHFPKKREELMNLLPFADCGTGDFFCFDYNHKILSKEIPVVFWDHETGEYKQVAESFLDFANRAITGEYSVI